MTANWGGSFAVLTATLTTLVGVTLLMRKYVKRKQNSKVYFKLKTKTLKTDEELKKCEWKKVGKVTELVIYPVKSFAGVKVESASAKQLGLEHNGVKDRILMVVNAKGGMITGRAVPKMVLIQPTWEKNILTLKFPEEEESISVDLDKVIQNNDKKKANVWGDDVNGLDCGEEVSEWLSKILKRTCRLVYHHNFEPTRDVYLEEYPIMKKEDTCRYADGYGFLLMAKETVDDLSKRVNCSVNAPNFRPNILVEGSNPYDEDDWEYIQIGSVRFRNIKPCTRCVFTTINAETGTKDANMEPLKTLKTYRCMEGNTSPCFGINLGIDVEGEIHVGDDIYVTYPNN